MGHDRGPLDSNSFIDLTSGLRHDSIDGDMPESEYLKRAASLIKRWMRYAPLDVVLNMPDLPPLEGGPPYTDWQADDETEESWTYRYPGHALHGITVPGRLLRDTFDFAWLKNGLPLFGPRRLALSDEVLERIFVTEDFSRRLTEDDLSPYFDPTTSRTYSVFATTLTSMPPNLAFHF